MNEWNGQRRNNRPRWTINFLTQKTRNGIEGNSGHFKRICRMTGPTICTDFLNTDAQMAGAIHNGAVFVGMSAFFEEPLDL